MRRMWIGPTLAMVALAGCAQDPGPIGAAPAARSAGSQAMPAAATRPAGDRAAATRPASEATAMAEGAGGPSVHGIARDDWPRVTFDVPAGRTVHYPTYFDRIPPAASPNGDEVIDRPTVVSRMRAALAGYRAAGWDKRNAGRFVEESVLFGWDLLTWPVSAGRRLPWRPVTTPPGASASETHDAPPDARTDQSREPAGGG